MRYWQVAAGDGQRDYSEVFIRYGLMLIGPGEPGSYLDYPNRYSRHIGQNGDVVQFAADITKGDIVILKKPFGKQWQIQAVGTVTGEYEFTQQFDDVEGWDLRHSRGVDWVLPSQRIVLDGLARGTFRQVHNKVAGEQASAILRTGARPKQPLALPNIAATMSEGQLVDQLVETGLRPGDAEDVIQTIFRIRRLANWYHRHRDGSQSEHEIRTFLIVPLLQALGWSEQRMKIEWKRTDIALFQDVYGPEAEPTIIVESKRLYEGLGGAQIQAARYAKSFLNCSRLVVSDGFRYHAYERHESGWRLSAYMNLLKLSSRHPYLPNVRGASELCIQMSPR